MSVAGSQTFVFVAAMSFLMMFRSPFFARSMVMRCMSCSMYSIVTATVVDVEGVVIGVETHCEEAVELVVVVGLVTVALEVVEALASSDIEVDDTPAAHVVVVDIADGGGVVEASAHTRRYDQLEGPLGG